MIAPGQPAGGSAEPWYRERLRCPISYWLIALAFGLSFVIALGLYLGPWIAVSFAVITAAGIATLLLWIGHPLIEVTERGLAVGASVLEWEYLGEVTALDRAAMRSKRGPQADLRAFVVERSYVADGIEVVVEDPADPHPVWLISTRQPQRLALALTRGRERFGHEEPLEGGSA